MAAPNDAPPGAPSITSATPGDGKVTLEWTAPDSTGFTGGNGAEGTITKYTVYYSDSSFTDVTGIDSVEVTGPAALTTDVSSLANGTMYYFRVTASNGTGEGAPSEEATATPTP